MEKPKFTQEIKDKWVEALESGNYKQGYVNLYDKYNNTFCCIGVLGDICDFLDNDYTDNKDEKSPYLFLKETIGPDDTEHLWKTNDKCQPGIPYRPEDYQDDYSNVLEFVKELFVQD